MFAPGRPFQYHCTVDLLFDWFGLVFFAKKCQWSYSWFKTSKQKVNGTVILPPLVFPGMTLNQSIVHLLYRTVLQNMAKSSKHILCIKYHRNILRTCRNAALFYSSLSTKNEMILRLSDICAKRHLLERHLCEVGQLDLSPSPCLVPFPLTEPFMGANGSIDNLSWLNLNFGQGLLPFRLT